MIKVLRKTLLFALCICAASYVFAGFNDTMDIALGEERLTLGSAAWMLLSGSGQIDGESSREEAARLLSSRIPGISTDPNTTVTLGEFSWYLMEVYGMKGGLIYSLFPGPRYALRELRFRDIVQGSAYPGMTLSGERALRILGRLVSDKEANQ
jgi:hypothetical protein